MVVRIMLFSGSFHLLHLMFDEYVLYTVENIHNQDKANDLLRAVRGDISLGTPSAVVHIQTLCLSHPCKLQNHSNMSNNTQHRGAMSNVIGGHITYDNLL